MVGKRHVSDPLLIRLQQIPSRVECPSPPPHFHHIEMFHLLLLPDSFFSLPTGRTRIASIKQTFFFLEKKIRLACYLFGSPNDVTMAEAKIFYLLGKFDQR